MPTTRVAFALVLITAICGGCGASARAWPVTDAADGLSVPIERWQPPPASIEAQRELAEALRLQGLGRVADAFERVSAALEVDPDLLEAHRLLQDLTIRSTADWWVRERYERRLASRPADADAHYLLARIDPDPVRQLELFTAAVELDPRHPYATLGRAIALARRGDVAAALGEARRSTELAPWLGLPWIWLGMESLKRGATAASARFFAAGRDRAEGDARPWLGLAQSMEELSEPAESSRNALAALRLAPGDDGIAGAATDLLERAAVPADLTAALNVLQSATHDGASPGPAEVLRGRLLSALGRHAEAVAAFDRAAELDDCALEVAQPLRSARVLAGRFREAVAGALKTLPRAALAPSSLYAPRWIRLRAAAAADLHDPRALLELAEAMASVGWLDESRAVLVAAGAAAPHDPVIAARSEREEAYAAFVTDLGRIARETRHAGRDPATLPSTADVLGRIADASIRRLGHDASAGAVVRNYPFLGTFAVSVASGGAFETTFGSHGLFCMVGSRAGSPVELVMGRLVVVRADARDEVLGEAIAFDECWLESEGLPADAAGWKRGLAGLTLDRLVLLQLDAVVRTPRGPVAGLPFVRRRAATRDELRALDTPSDVAARIEAKLAAEGRIEGAVLDSVRRHELVHVHDAARMLPISSHPFKALAFALSHGFSAAATERALEAHAQAISILAVREPRAALAALVAFLPARDGDTAHTGAYRNVTQTAVDLIIDDPGTFSSIDLTFNVLQQLDALTDAEVRELGRRLSSRF